MHDFASVGITLPYGASGEFRTDCPQCDNRCLSVEVNDGIWYCHYCGWKGGLRYRRNGYIAHRPIAKPNPKAQQAIKRVWQESRLIETDNPVHRYLLQRRLNFNELSDLSHVLRYHPCLPYYHGDDHWTHHPAMIAPVSNPQGVLVSIHRTYLTRDGHKANVPKPKKLMPTAIRGATRGGAVRLYPSDNILGVAEGIETALAVRLATGLPVWATISAVGMATLALPEGVSTVVVFADNDPSRTGQEAAKALARRMLTERRTVKILTPNVTGMDWADTVSPQEMRHG